MQVQVEKCNDDVVKLCCECLTIMWKSCCVYIDDMFLYVPKHLMTIFTHIQHVFDNVNWRFKARNVWFYGKRLLILVM